MRLTTSLFSKSPQELDNTNTGGNWNKGCKKYKAKKPQWSDEEWDTYYEEQKNGKADTPGGQGNNNAKKDEVLPPPPTQAKAAGANTGPAQAPKPRLSEKEVGLDRYNDLLDHGALMVAHLSLSPAELHKMFKKGGTFDKLKEFTNENGIVHSPNIDETNKMLLLQNVMTEMLEDNVIPFTFQGLKGFYWDENEGPGFNLDTEVKTAKIFGVSDPNELVFDFTLPTKWMDKPCAAGSSYTNGAVMAMLFPRVLNHGEPAKFLCKLCHEKNNKLTLFRA